MDIKYKEQIKMGKLETEDRSQENFGDSACVSK